MRSRALIAVALAAVLACRKPPALEPPPIPAPAPPQVEGTLTVEGLSARVTIVRDRSGIPHITASNQDDLFFAQGFVQAQDRLFQMDLWRRSVQGRLSEVLGSNFIERDAMTRRIQYRGNLEAEWASYGPDARAIATAFTRGINAWIAITRERLPEEFALAGWTPDRWAPEDLLNRTEAFLASHGAGQALLCARLIRALGEDANNAGRVLPFCPSAGRSEGGVDYTLITDSVSEMVRRVGTRPFFTGLNAPVPGRLQSESPVTVPPLTLTPPVAAGSAFALGGAQTASGLPLLAGSWSGDLDSPAPRYLVHLQAPGWNVIGATSPWRPGVSMGHNERISWAFAPGLRWTQEVFVERLNPANQRQVATPNGWRDLTVVIESVAVKGRQEPFESEQLYGPHGPIMGVDRERQLAYAVRWSGAEPGGAAELGALSLARAQSWPDFQAALQRWKMPVAEFAYTDVENRLGTAFAGLVPLEVVTNRRDAQGDGPGAVLPRPGWTRAATTPVLTKLAGGPASTPVVVVRQSELASRLRTRLVDAHAATVETVRAIQHDVIPPNSGQLIPRLDRLQPSDPAVQDARARLMAWDGKVSADSLEALLYVTWEDRLMRRLTMNRVPPRRVDELMARAPDLIAAASVWRVDGTLKDADDELLRDTLAAAVDDLRRLTSADGTATWGRFNQLTFRHPLAITARAARRYDVGPFAMPGYASTVFSTWRATQERSAGPVLQLLMDAGDWDRSRGMVVPGQSAAPDSPHFADLAPIWARGEDVPLPFSAAAVAAAAESTLALEPR